MAEVKPFEVSKPSTGFLNFFQKQPKALTLESIKGTRTKKGERTRISSRYKRNLNSEAGLRRIAEDNGITSKVTRFQVKGEAPKEIFSGGWVMDTFDTLNLLQYGVTGVFKGKGFAEGVRSRESFTDDDALGKHGLIGVVAGVAADIAIDPLTYIAPWTAIAKISKGVGISRALKEGTKLLRPTRVGQATEKSIDFFGQGLVYGYGWDPVWKKQYEKFIVNKSIAIKQAVTIVQPISKLDTNAQKSILTARKAGTLHELPKELLDTARPAFEEIDRLGKEAVSLGLLSGKIYDENVGKYLATLYRKFEDPKVAEKAKNFFSPSQLKTNVDRFKKAKDIPEEIREAMGEVLEAGYPTAKTLIQLTGAIEDARFFNKLSKQGKFVSVGAKEGWVKLPKTSRLETTAGRRSELATEIKDINKTLKIDLKGLQKTFKGDKVTLKTLSKLGVDINEMEKSLGSKLSKFVSGREEIITKPGKVTRKLGIITPKLNNIANDVKAFDDFATMKASDVGKKLEKKFIDGDLEAANFKSMKEFFDTVKKPFKVIEVSAKKVVSEITEKDLTSLRKQIEKAREKLDTVRDIDKVSINDSLLNLEQKINNLRFAKEDIVENLHALKLGELGGKYVPKYIADLVNESMDVGGGVGRRVMGAFKFSKVILNPATHARNILSNLFLNHFEGLNPLLPQGAKAYATASKELLMLRKGKQGKWYKEAFDQGLGIDTFAASELKGFLKSPEMTKIEKLHSGTANAFRKIADMYQKEEEFSKLAQYIFQRQSKGKSAAEAWAIAERATFNYAQVGPWIKTMRQSMFGYPFITFSYKAAPQIARVIGKDPTKISNIGKIKQAIESLSPQEELERERATEPDWVRNGMMIRMPFKDKVKDANGKMVERSLYFDMTYILPFGDLISGQLIDTRREDGLPESFIRSIARKLPFPNLVAELQSNKNFLGDRIFKASDDPLKVATDMFIHILKTMTPPPIGEQLPSGYNKRGERRKGAIDKVFKLKTGGQGVGGITTRTPMEELGRNIGIKFVPIDPDLQEKMFNRQNEAILNALLESEGIIRNMEIPYFPKF